MASLPTTSRTVGSWSSAWSVPIRSACRTRPERRVKRYSRSGGSAAFGGFFFGLRGRADGAIDRLADEVQHAHAVDEDDGSAEPPAQGEEAEADDGQDERPGGDVASLEVVVAEDRGQAEEDRGRHHRAHVERRRLP